MWSLKKICIQYFLLFEVAIFLIIFVFGQDGLIHIYDLKAQVAIVKNDIILVQNDINILKKRIEDWQLYPFYKEKLAREQLHMANCHDLIIYTDQKESI